MKFDIEALKAILEWDELISSSIEGLWGFTYLREDGVSIFLQFNELEDNASVQISRNRKRKQHLQAFNLKEIRVNEKSSTFELVADDVISKINVAADRVIEIETKNA